MKYLVIISLILVGCRTTYNPPMGGGEKISFERVERVEMPIYNGSDTIYIDTFMIVQFDTVIDYSKANYWQGLTRYERRQKAKSIKREQVLGYQLAKKELENEALKIRLDTRKEVKTNKHTQSANKAIARAENRRGRYAFWLGFILCWLIMFIWRNRKRIFKKFG